MTLRIHFQCQLRSHWYTLECLHALTTSKPLKCMWLTRASPQDLVKSRYREIRVSAFPIALKIDSHLGSNATEISEWYDHYNIRSRSFETSQDLTVRRPPLSELRPFYVHLCILCRVWQLTKSLAIRVVGIVYITTDLIIKYSTDEIVIYHWPRVRERGNSPITSGVMLKVVFSLLLARATYWTSRWVADDFETPKPSTSDVAVLNITLHFNSELLPSVYILHRWFMVSIEKWYYLSGIVP